MQRAPEDSELVCLSGLQPHLPAGASAPKPALRCRQPTARRRNAEPRFKGGGRPRPREAERPREATPLLSREPGRRAHSASRGGCCCGRVPPRFPLYHRLEAEATLRMGTERQRDGGSSGAPAPAQSSQDSGAGMFRPPGILHRARLALMEAQSVLSPLEGPGGHCSDALIFRGS